MAAEPAAEPPRPRPTRRKSLAPNPKVAAAGLAGAIATIGFAVFSFEPDPELAAAITTVIAFVAGYFTPAT